MEQVVMFLKQVINGVQVGSIYALVALGYTMVYGIVKLLNFAHGDFIMVGAYISLFAMTGAGMPVWACCDYRSGRMCIAWRTNRKNRI